MPCLSAAVNHHIGHHHYASPPLLESYPNQGIEEQYMADWAALPHELLLSIAEKIMLIEDFVAFGSVCKSWREATRDNKQYLRPQVPWLMLAEKEEDAGSRQIYSLSKEKILTKNLYIPELSDKKCIGLNYGWVMTISRKGKGEMSLVHPISRHQIELPPQSSIYGYNEDKKYPHIFTHCAALSANPSETSEFVLMIVHSVMGKYLSYWRRGDKQWNMAKDQEPKEHAHSDLIYCKDQFFALTYSGQVWSCKLDDDGNYRRSFVTEIDYQLVEDNLCYIVESGGVLLVMVRQEDTTDIELEYQNQDDDGEPTTLVESLRYWLVSFRVYELDLIKGVHKQIENLGDRAIFVGHNTSISLDNVSQFPGIKPNHIYYTDDQIEIYPHNREGGGTDMGYYNLEDDQKAQFKVGESLSRLSPPFWFIPSLQLDFN